MRRAVLKQNNKEVLHSRMDSLPGEGTECIKYNKFKTLDSAIPKSAFLKSI